MGLRRSIWNSRGLKRFIIVKILYINITEKTSVECFVLLPASSQQMLSANATFENADFYSSSKSTSRAVTFCENLTAFYRCSCVAGRGEILPTFDAIVVCFSSDP
jgi:hypothetical protein